MPTLSIVIVSYNVKFFLRQSIQSILNSNCSFDYEIIVVDNDSQDGSVNMLNTHFPEIKTIVNDKNVGFSKANNQAFKISEAQYILILNPDTIIQEDTLQKCFDHMEANAEVGALGVKMVDGAGQYLPESKRGFPTPLNAIWKMMGLSKIFPKSKTFNKYYLGHLSEKETNTIEVLTGAFFFTRKKVLDQIGGFDEDYFMYGEDIELSYQVINAGHRITYLPTTSIIHFKGESTSKSSIRYLKSFYGAMDIYSKKRNRSSGFLWKAILQLGIIISGILHVIKRTSRFFLRLIIDFGLLVLITKLITKAWGSLYFENIDYYQNSSSDLTIVILCLFLVFIYYFFGQYDKKHDLKHLLYGFVFGTLGMLSIILIVGLLSPFILFLTRKILNRIRLNTWAFDSSLSKRIAIVGNQDSSSAVKNIIESLNNQFTIVGVISDQSDSNFNLGRKDEIQEIVKSRNINELIFCSRDLDSSFIFSTMASFGNEVNYKIADKDNKSILGSASKNKIGEWYTLDIDFKISQLFHRRTKRVLDVLFALSFIFLSPVVLIFSKLRSAVFSNLISVIFGFKTWMSYNKNDDQISELPILKNSVFEVPVNLNQTAHDQNVYYARNYSVWLEIEYLLKKIFGGN